MIIVSQHKKYIVNFANVETIGMDKSNGQYYINCTYSDGNSILAIYDTEERAKEVLQEIIELISEDEFYHIRKSQLNSLDGLEEPKYILKPVSRPKVYEMPEE